MDVPYDLIIETNIILHVKIIILNIHTTCRSNIIYVRYNICHLWQFLIFDLPDNISVISMVDWPDILYSTSDLEYLW